MATPASQLEFLSPGSVWMRKDGRTAKFLFITNTALKAKTQLQHPPQVVYADNDGKVYNRDIDGFLEMYKFYNVDGELELKLNNLFVFNEADYASDDAAETAEASEAVEQAVVDLLVTDEVPQSANEGTLAEQLMAELSGDNEPVVAASNSNDGVHVGFAFAVEEGLVDSPLSARELTDSLVVYSQDPNGTFNLTQHRLLFELSEKVTIDNLRTAFAPSETNSTVDAFEVRTKLGTDLVYWTHFIGVYPEFSTNGLYASVLVGTEDNPSTDESDFRVEESDVSEHQDVASVQHEDGSVTTTSAGLPPDLNAQEVTASPTPAAVFEEAIQQVPAEQPAVTLTVTPAPAEPVVVAPVQPADPQ
jgi:hypothetical protein